MRMLLKCIIVAVLFLSFFSCSGLNQRLAKRTYTIEYYRIFDIKTNNSRYDVAKAAMDGLAKNCGSVNEEMPLPNFSTPPEKPGRFKIKNLLEGSKFAALVAAQGGSLNLKTAICPDAVWIGKAEKKDYDWYHIKLTGCLFQYKEGYHLDIYAIFTKQTGGINISRSIGKALAGSAVGTPEQWTEKVFADTVRTIYEKTHAKIKFLEGNPPVQGTPWIDSGKDVYK